MGKKGSKLLWEKFPHCVFFNSICCLASLLVAGEKRGIWLDTGWLFLQHFSSYANCFAFQTFDFST